MKVLFTHSHLLYNIQKSSFEKELIGLNVGLSDESVALDPAKEPAFSVEATFDSVLCWELLLKCNQIRETKGQFEAIAFCKVSFYSILVVW